MTQTRSKASSPRSAAGASRSIWRVSTEVLAGAFLGQAQGLGGEVDGGDGEAGSRQECGVAPGATGDVGGIAAFEQVPGVGAADEEGVGIDSPWPP